MAGVSPAVFQSAGQRSEHFVPGAYSRSAAMVVNGNTQAEAALRSGETEVLRLRTASWGTAANGIARQISDGTNPGTKMVRIFKGDDGETIDNIGRRLIEVRYTGDGTAAALAVGRDGVSAEVIGPDGGSDRLSIPFEAFPTVEEVVARLNGTGYFAAVRLGGEANVPSSELDHVDCADAKAGSAILTSNFFALIRALENSPWIGMGNVERVHGAPNAVPDNDADPVFFDGAVAGTCTAADWGRALSALETENVQMIATPSTDRAVHALISNHCASMSSVQNRRERTALLGGPIGETIDEAAEFAENINSRLVSYCYPGILASSPLTGEAEELPASFLACKLMGMETVVAVNEPLTWKTVGALRFLASLRIPEMERLIRGGVLCGGVTDDNRLAVIRAMTTHRGRQLQLAERSMVRQDLYMNRDLRMRYSLGVGRPGADGGGSAEQTLHDAARAWRGEGLIVPDGEGRNIWGVVVRRAGDRITVSFHRNLTAPQNFFFITAYNHVYESAVTVEI